MEVTQSIAWRFMTKGTEKGSFSAMTFFSWLAIGVGIAAMSGLLAVMYGFEGSLKEKVLNAYPHVTIDSKIGNQPIRHHEGWTEKLRNSPLVSRVEPYLQTEMILQSGYRTLGGVVLGIARADFERLQSGLAEGKLPDPQSKQPQVVMGKELAHRLGVFPGGEIKIISPTGKSGAMGAVPESETFEIVGLYASGHYEFDEQYLYILMEDAQDLMKWDNAISGWHVWTENMENADAVQAEIATWIDPAWQAQSWTVFNAALFQSLKLEQYCMTTILSFAILIAVMNIVITLMMHVTHKRKNVGILRALGASKKQIRQIFVWQGAWMGMVGLGLGALLTTIFVVYVKYFSQYQLPEIYYDRTIPIEIRPLSLLAIYGGAILCIYLATLYPAMKAARLDPIEVIRE